MDFNELCEAQFNDIAILQLPDNRYLLILLCEQMEGAKKLHKIIKSNKFETLLNIKNDKTFDFWITFTNTKFEIKQEINLTAEEFPDILQIANSNISFMTAGVRSDILPLSYLPDYVRVGRPQMN
jgi:hypothetical protein